MKNPLKRLLDMEKHSTKSKPYYAHSWHLIGWTNESFSTPEEVEDAIEKHKVTWYVDSVDKYEVTKH